MWSFVTSVVYLNYDIIFFNQMDPAECNGRKGYLLNLKILMTLYCTDIMKYKS